MQGNNSTGIPAGYICPFQLWAVAEQILQGSNTSGVNIFCYHTTQVGTLSKERCHSIIYKTGIRLQGHGLDGFVCPEDRFGVQVNAVGHTIYLVLRRHDNIFILANIFLENDRLTDLQFIFESLQRCGIRSSRHGHAQHSQQQTRCQQGNDSSKHPDHHLSFLKE